MKEGGRAKIREGGKKIIKKRREGRMHDGVKWDRNGRIIWARERREGKNGRKR